MSNQDRKQKKRKGKGSGLIAFGVVFALYAVMFHPYSLGRLLLGLIVAGLISTVIRVMGSGLDLTTHNKQDAVPESLEKVAKDTGNPDVDALLQKGRQMISEIREENRKIPDEGLSDKLDQLEKLCGDIFKAVYDKPAKASQIRKFMDYYLPTTLKLLNAYDRASAAGVSGENIDSTMRKVESMMKTIVTAFEKQLDALFGDEALDISTDITVLDNMMAREGLTGDQLHAETTPKDDIKLDL